MDTLYTIMKNKSEFSITLLNSPLEVEQMEVQYVYICWTLSINTSSMQVNQFLSVL